MTFHLHRIAFALLAITTTTFGGWDGFPCPSNVPYYSVETNRYIAQLYTGLIERCKASGVSSPQNVDTLTVFAGYTNTYTVTNYVSGGTTNSYTITNNFIVYKTIVTTNAFAPFSYTWTNGAGGISTAYPPVRSSWFTTWDSKFSSVVGSGIWVMQDDCGLLTNSTADGYFDVSSNVLDFPIWTVTNLFIKRNIGIVTNGNAYFVHKPDLSTNEWALGAIRKTTTNTWIYKQMTALPSGIYDASIRPVIEYWPSAGTNVFSEWTNTSITITLTGTAIRVSDQAQTTAVETITMTSSNDLPLTAMWSTVTKMGMSTTNMPNPFDAFRIVYKGGFIVYSSPGYRLYAADINERRKALDALTITRHRLYITECPDRTNRCYAGNANDKGSWQGGGIGTSAVETAENAWGWDQGWAFWNDNGTYYFNRLYVGTIGDNNAYDAQYGARICGDTSTNWLWTTMPSSMNSQPVHITAYLRLTPFRFTGRGVIAFGETTDEKYENFGLYPEMPMWKLHSFTNGIITGPGTDQWSIGCSNKSLIASNWCDQPLVPSFTLKTKGFAWKNDVLSFWVQLTHTNWMTKW